MQQTENRIRQEFRARQQSELRKFEEQQARLEKERQEFEQKKQRENEMFQQRLKAKVAEECKAMEEELKHKLSGEHEEQYKLLQLELNEKSEQIKELNRTKAEIERLKREKEELREAVELDLQQKLNEQITTERERIRKQEEDKNELKFREMQKKLDDQLKLVDEMKRKQAQGSMQMQGEVQELAIEEWLAARFPLDTIEGIKTGARGGDCLQIVHTHAQQNCGKIYYESKRTKDFQPAWIAKFKADIQASGADIGILVTEAMPADMERMGVKEGVWICNFEEFKGLCGLMRETIVRLSMVATAQENKGEKMYMLYDYLTSNTFHRQVETIVDAFTALKTGLDKEKRSMQRIWVEREKQIERVVQNTIDMHATVRGIAGNSIQPIEALELPHADLLPEGL